MARTPGPRGSKTARRKETGKSPQSMEDLFRALLKNSPYVTLLISPDGTIAYESRPVKGLLGYRPEDRTGANPFDYLHPEDVARAEAALAELAGNPSYRVITKLRARHADGSWRTLQVIGQNRLDDPALGHIVASFRDITELRQREEALQESEARYSVLVEHAKEGVYVAQDSVIKFANPAMSEITGYTNEELQGMDPVSLVISDYQAEVAQRHESRPAGDSLPPVMELRIRRKDGTERTIEASGTAIQYEGSPAIMGVVRDVTERRQMEEALRESEEKWRTLVETAPERIMTVDRDGTILFANRVTPGHTVEEAIGTRLYDYLLPQYEKVAREAVRSVFKSATIERWEAEAIALDGENMWFESIAAPIVRDGDVVAAIIISMDVTERKRAEENVKRQERYFRALIENSLDAIAVLNKDGSHSYASPSYERILGRKPGGGIDKRGIEYIYEEDWPRAADAFARLVRNPGDGMHEEIRVWHEDGSLRTVEVVSHNLLDDPAVQGIVSNFRDITLKKEAEEELRRAHDELERRVEERTSELTEANRALRESEMRFRDMANLLPQIVFEIDRRGNLIFANRAVLDTTGYDQTDVDRGLNAFDTLVPKDRARARRNMRRVLGREKLGGNEYTMVRKDGTLFPVIVYTSPIVENGKPTGIRGIAIDVTERKRIEADLRRSEEYFRSLIENSMDAIAVLSADGTIQYQSESIKRMMGHSPEDRVGRDSLGFVHPDDARNAAGVFAQLVQTPGASVHYELRVAHGDGSWRTLETVARNLLDEPTVAGIVCNIRDVTERKEAQEALEREEKYFRALIENSLEVVVVMDGDGTIHYESPSAAKITGYTLEERQGKSIFEMVHPDDRPGLIEKIKGLLASPGGIEQADFRGLWKDGWHHVEGSAHNLLHDPAVGGIVVNFRDVTERKRGEEQAQEIYNQEKELRERLEVEMRRRIEFTRALAHELKTPLTAVLASSDLLVSEIEDETLLGLARNIRQGASNLDDRIDELLDLARGEVGMLHLKTESIDLLQLLREAADRMTPRTVEHGQSLVPALPPKLPAVQADAARLEQVVSNLLDNAIKFTPRGGRITLRARESKGQVTVEVQDTGRGIPREARERLFEPYQRLDSDRDNLSGLGLGLSLSKTLIELHGGTIWVKSRIGRGSTFGFTIPLRAAQQQAQEPEQPRKLWKVLIIEDDRDIVDFVALNFRLRWPEADLISTGLGDEGVEMVESEDPNVVILDLGLPDISGFEVLRQIRLFSSVPVIILTVRGDEADMVKGLEWGADDYIVKPFRQSELLARLKVQLRKQTPPDEEAPIVCGSLRLDPSTFQLTHGTEEISLTIVEGRIIEHLMRNAGHVVTHASLAEAVWGADYPGAIDSLRVYIRYIRQKLEADPGHPKLILTKAGVGYSLARPI